MTTATATEARPWRLFAASVSAVRQLSPSFVRVTFAGPEMTHFGDDRNDQRIKLILPAPDGSLDILEAGDNWWAELRERPEHRRNTVRTYTSRTVRADEGEIDVDFVLHGDEGPASRWAGAAQVGDEVVICGPNRLREGPYGGTGFAPGAEASRYLLVADETAVPAALAILEGLPSSATGAAMLEVPHDGDVLPMRAPSGVQVHWLAREERALGDRLASSVHAVLDDWFGPVESDASSEVIEVDELVWDVPTEDVGSGFYAWMAGEAGVITGLRRHLVKERGIDKGSVSFMGYWRLGRSEN